MCIVMILQSALAPSYLFSVQYLSNCNKYEILIEFNLNLSLIIFQILL